MDVLRISRRRRVAAMIAAVATVATAAGIVTAAPPANASSWPEPHLLSVYSNQCLDVLGFNSSDGATIGQWPCNGASNQDWDIVWDLNGRSFKIVSQFSGKCMDVAGANYQAWARIIQYTCVDGAPEQHFIYKVVGYNGSNWLVTFHPVEAQHMCFDVLGATHNYGAPLGLWPCVEDAPEQAFIAMFI